MAWLALSAATSAQAFIGSIAPPAGHRGFGTSLARLDDLDGDGIPEVAAAHVLGVDIVSTGTGTVLRTVAGSTQCAAIEDVDGDGLREVVSFGRLLTGAGELAVRSSVAASTQWSLNLPAIGVLGGILRVVSDIDGDGISDIVTTDVSPGAELTVARSGRSGALLWRRGPGARAGDLVFEELCSVGDLNGDGAEEIAATFGLAIGGGIDILDGATGTSLRRVNALPLEELGRLLCPIDDWDGDGFDDLAAYSDQLGSPTFNRRIILISVRTGTRLTSFPTLQTLGGSPRMLARTADVNGDGLDELVECNSVWTGTYFGSELGYVGIRSIVDGRWLRVMTGRPNPSGDEVVGTSFLELVRAGSWPLFATGRYGDGIALMNSVPTPTPKDAMWEIDAVGDERCFGVAVARGDDIDGDLVSDFYVSAPLLQGSLESRIVAISGRTGGRILTSAPGAGQVSGFLGHTLVPIGDYDGDGVTDLVAGQEWPGARLLSGRTLGVLDALPASFGTMVFGPSVIALGDQDGDGLAELLLSDVPTSGPRGLLWPGMAAVWSPGSRVILRTHAGTAGSSQNLGSAATSLGDRTGDGRAEYALGAPSFGAGTGLGEVQIYSGLGPLLRTLPGLSNEGNFGAALASADFDGDGFQDLAVSAPTTTPVGGAAEAGRLIMYSGAAALARTWSLDGSQALEQFGERVLAIADVSGDGLPDIAVVQLRVANALGGLGRITLLRGFDGQVLRRIESGAGFGSVGTSLTSVPDRNGDGIAELLVGVPGAASAAGPHGAAWLVSGAAPDLAQVNALGGGCSVGGGFRPVLTASPPALSQLPGRLNSFALTLDAGPPSGMAWLFLGAAPASPYPLPPSCLVYVEPAGALSFPAIPLDSAGRITWPFALPAEPALGGLIARFQAITQNAVGAPDLSDGLELILGY